MPQLRIPQFAVKATKGLAVPGWNGRLLGERMGLDATAVVRRAGLEGKFVPVAGKRVAAADIKVRQSVVPSGGGREAGRLELNFFVSR